MKPDWPKRLAVAVLCGVIFWALASLKLRAAGPYAMGYDFTFHWRAGDALRRGYSPYAVINGFSTLYLFSAGYFYWLPTAIILEPLSLLPLQTAMPIFAGLSVAIFAYALTVDGWWRLPFLASAPLVFGALSGQVVPLVVAAILVPSLGWLAPMKYTIGVAGVAYNLSLRYTALGAAVVLVSVIVFPWWPRQWIAELHDVVGGPYYHVPIKVLGGFLVLAALIRWRRPEARLLVVMACVPQTMLFYDQLPLLLVARGRREAIAAALASWAAPLVAVALHGAGPRDRVQLFAWNAPVIVACYYLPCLILVLKRANDGRLPAWVDRLTGRRS